MAETQGMMTAEQLRRYRGDVVAWAQENVVIRNPLTGKLGLVVLAPHQVEFLRAATARDAAGDLIHRVCVACWPKREGKSLCVALLGAWRMACYTNQINIVLANSERQAASVLYDELVGMFRNSPRLRMYIGEDDVQTKRLSVPRLGNSVQCVPCNERTVQGIGVRGVLMCDELHAVQDPGAYRYLSAQTEAVDAQVLISSQAGEQGNSNPIWLLYQAREQPHILFSYSDQHMQPWAIALAERQRSEMLPGEWAYLHENRWGGLGQKLFRPDLVAGAAMDYAEPTTRQEWERLQESWGVRGRCVVGVGLDRAGVSAQGDDSVWTGTARWDEPRGRIYRVVMCEVPQTGSEEEILELRDRTLEIYGKPAMTYCEYYGCSDVVGKLPGAELVTPTGPRQQASFGGLERAIREGRWGYPVEAGHDWRNDCGGLLKAQLLAFEYRVMGGAAVKMGTQSGHDDCAYSACWSRDAADQGGREPYGLQPTYASAGAARRYGPRAR